MPPRRRLSHVVGFDDGPFERTQRGDVLVVGAVFAAGAGGPPAAPPRLEGILTGRVRRDGANATEVLARLVAGSRFRAHLQAVLLQGIALGGFNVVDVAGLHARTGLPILVVARRAPDLAAIRRALLDRVPGGRRKWRLVERAGPMEPLAGVWVQRAGLTPAEAASLLSRFAVNGMLPEPVRVAHLVAGGIVRGESRGRA
ncbi:MAG TPA: DUF99 family protein [Myxococcota bacterium]|nr:DUF99 family protein [Myxococcota bacterium]